MAIGGLQYRSYFYAGFGALLLAYFSRIFIFFFILWDPPIPYYGYIIKKKSLNVKALHELFYKNVSGFTSNQH